MMIGLTWKLKRDIARTVANHTPFSHLEIERAITKFNSIDEAIKACDLALRNNKSLADMITLMQMPTDIGCGCAAKSNHPGPHHESNCPAFEIPGAEGMY